MVVAVVSAPSVIAAWFSWIVSIVSLMKSVICASCRCSGPSISQVLIWSRLSDTCDCSCGRPFVNVMITNVSSPPSTPMPAIITIAAAAPRGTRHCTSRSTPGAISADSSSAIATGTTRCEK